MKSVIATALGFHDGAMVPVGTVFEVEDKLKGKWFKPWDGSEAAEEPEPPKGNEPIALSELGRNRGEAPVTKVPGHAKAKKGAKPEPPKGAKKQSKADPGRPSDQDTI